MRWRERAAWVGVILCAPLAAGAQSTFKPQTPFQAQQVETLAPVTGEQAVVPVLPEGTPGGATALEWNSLCSATQPGVGVVNLRWKAGAALEQEQRLDVTALHEGFSTGKYLATASLPAEQLSAAFERPEPGISYYWRVLTLNGSGWIPSKVHRFDAPTCPVDSAEPESDR